MDFDHVLENVSDQELSGIVRDMDLAPEQFLALLSDKSDPYLERMAEVAHAKSLRNFGKAILLYTPLYLSNYCINGCIYCGFNTKNKIERRKLTLDEVDAEARAISATGLRHILILTGESRPQSPVSYIKDCIKILQKYFTSISIEIYPLEEEEYRELIEEGVDGLTLYQEVYDEERYGQVHLFGPKTDYRFRLDAPERACKAMIRNVSIGSLLGLTTWQKEIFWTGLHAKYLQDKYPHTEISVSLPRIRPAEGLFEDVVKVRDKDLVKSILALRMFLPRVGITISTRETAELRENLLPLGITKMSAGSTTLVGGHTLDEKDAKAQFAISDNRSVQEIRKMLLSKGYQPVLKDWWY